MLSYKDQTWCNSDCTNFRCFRHFGLKEQEGARRWWSHDPENAPIAFADFSDDCDKYKPKI